MALLAVVGSMLGLGYGYLLYPDSNLLGGFALVFAPVGAVGGLVLVVGWFACLVSWWLERPR